MSLNHDRPGSNIGLVSTVGIPNLAMCLKVLTPLVKQIFLIAAHFEDSFSSTVHVTKVNIGSTARPMVIRIFRFILSQLKVSLILFKARRNIGDVVFSLGATTWVILALTVKLVLKKKLVLILAGMDSRNVRHIGSDWLFGAGGTIIAPGIQLLEKISFSLADRLVVYSGNLIEEWHLGKYRGKILIASEQHVDLDKFKMQKSLSERSNLVGYLGRLSKEKGVLNFIAAMPRVLEKAADVSFLISGRKEEVPPATREFLEKENLYRRIRFVGWIAREELPKYLNELKLLILPSYTEGLPFIMLEAMACGTPVVATAVGSIPDIITDGQTGFIMEDNSPERLAQSICRALNYPNLEEISRNARALVEKDYTYEAAVARYRTLFASLT